MLKTTESVKTLEARALDRLQDLLGRVPGLEIIDGAAQPLEDEWRRDVALKIRLGDARWTLIVEVKPNGQPMHIRSALHQLNKYRQQAGAAAVPILIAPFLSAEGRRLCLEDGVSFVDLFGNARLSFGAVYIETEVEGSPAAERRGVKSLFRPKSAQVLRVLLRDPKRPWRVAELAEVADVSLGHVSNVRAGLIEREWATVLESGLVIAKPDEILDAWVEAYEPPAGKRMKFYTPLHGDVLQKAVRSAIDLRPEQGGAMLASFSAAQWLAPFGRHASQFLYCDAAALDHISSELRLEPTSKGENVIVTVLSDAGLFRDAISPAEGVLSTSVVQTYLDLAASGERGKEAAEHLRRERLKW
jgi:hypothetical protein